MRFRVTFSTDKVPLLYRNVFMSFLKEVLQATPSGKWRYRQLFSFGHGRRNKAPKPFCFAVRFLHDRDRFTQDQSMFYLRSPLVLYLSVADPGLAVDFYNGLLQDTLYPFHRGEFVLPRPESILPLRERPVPGEEVLFRTLAPVLVEDASGKPVLPWENYESFVRELNSCVHMMLLGTRGYGLKRDLSFEPVRLRKEVIRHAVRERDEEFRVYTFTCFSGQFVLRGDEEDLMGIQVLGLGRRRSQGFGMVEVIG